MFEDIVLCLDPFLIRKIEVVALERGMTFAEAAIFLCQAVITPRRDAEPGLA